MIIKIGETYTINADRKKVVVKELFERGGKQYVRAKRVGLMGFEYDYEAWIFKAFVKEADDELVKKQLTEVEI